MARQPPPANPPACPRCGLDHEQVDFIRWTWLVRNTKPKPPGRGGTVLWMLGSRADPRTGCGWTTDADLAELAEASKDTVERATRWARDRLLLHRSSKGYRVTDERAEKSHWILTDPASHSRTVAGMDASHSRNGAVMEPEAIAATLRSHSRTGAALKLDQLKLDQKDPKTFPSASARKKTHGRNLAAVGSEPEPSVLLAAKKTATRNQPATSDRGEHMHEVSEPLPLEGLPPAELTPNQRAKVITDVYAATKPRGMIKFLAVRGIVARAINAGEWSDDQIQAALLRIGARPRCPVTLDTLTDELQQPGHNGNRTSNGRPVKFRNPVNQDVYDRGPTRVRHA